MSAFPCGGAADERHRGQAMLAAAGLRWGHPPRCCSSRRGCGEPKPAAPWPSDRMTVHGQATVRSCFRCLCLVFEDTAFASCLKTLPLPRVSAAILAQDTASALCSHCLRGSRHCLCPVFSLPSQINTLPLPCVSTAFAAKYTAFALYFHCLRG